MLPQPQLNEPGLHELLLAPVTYQDIPEFATQLLRQAAQQLRGTANPGSPIDTRQLMDQLAGAIKLLRLAPRQVVQQVQQQVEQIQDPVTRKIAFNLYFQALLVAGSNPTVLQAAQLVTTNRNKLSTAQQVQFLATIPKYVKYPTKDLLKALFEMVDNLKEFPYRYNAAILGFSQLLHQACMNRVIQRVKYPVELYGRFCSPEVVESTFLPPIFKQLKQGLQETTQQKVSERAVVILNVLGNIGHPAVLPKVQEIVREGDYPRMIKIAAIFALKNLVNDYDGALEAVTPDFIQNSVLPFLSQVTVNVNRKAVVRMAALTLLVKSQYATQRQWEQVAALTSNDPDEEIRTYAASTVVNIARMKDPVTRQHVQMQKNARQVVQRVQKVHAQPLGAFNFYQAHEVRDLDIEYFYRYAQFRSNSSVFPTHFYAKSQVSLGKHGLPIIPYEVSLSLVNLNDAIQQRNYRTFQAFLNVRLLNNIQDIIKIDPEVVESLVETVQENVAHAFQQNTATAQKMIMLSEFTKEIPTALGMPLTKKLRAPLLISTHVKLGQAQLQNNGQAAQAQASVRIVAVARHHVWIALKVPFLGQKFQSGVDARATVELPFRALARVGTSGAVELAITPAYIQGGSQPQGQVRLVKVKRVPYTAQLPSTLHRALQPQSSDIQITPIRTTKNAKQQQVQLGQEEMGFKLVYTREQDKPKKNYGVLTGYVSAELNLDLDKSRTNTIYMAAAVGQQEEQDQSNSDEDEEATLAIAIVGKKAVVQPVSQQTKMQDIREGQTNTFQYYGQVTIDPDYEHPQQAQAFVRFASGQAANDAAQKLSESEQQFKPVRQAILQGSTPQQQTDLCIEAQHEFNFQAPQNYYSRQHNQQFGAQIQQELKYGPRCQKGQMRNKLTTQAQWTSTPQTHQGSLKMTVSSIPSYCSIREFCANKIQ